MTTFEITGIQIGDGLDGEESGEVITQFRYSEHASGDLYATKGELIHLIRSAHDVEVFAVNASGSRTKVIVVSPTDTGRPPFLRTVGDRSSGNDLLSLPRF